MSSPSQSGRLPAEEPADSRLDADLRKVFGLGAGPEDWLANVRRAVAMVDLGHLGQFQVIREAGRGGQGVVYQARQPGTNRTVAAKCLTAGELAGAAVARFRREIEATAALDHPGIVTVHGSEVVNGRPVMVMEWVDGEPIDAWSGHPGQPLVEVLEVFWHVCDAVHHAHQRGIIHRDLKPSNILIIRPDRHSAVAPRPAARPKVLDFGVAKVLESAGIGAASAGGEATLTRSGFVGTPAYAAPEQLRGAPRDIDVRTDVFALGVILYRIVTGRLPFSPEGGLAALVAAVCESDPPAPSLVRAGLDRELDAIVMKAIEKEPRRRYPSVDALAQDIRRYIDGEPVSAVPPSGWYALRKLVRRQRLAFALSGAVFVLTVVFGVVATGLAVQYARERDAAQRSARAEERARRDADAARLAESRLRTQAQQLAEEAQRHAEEAEAQRAIAEAVNAFLNEDVLAAAGPGARREHRGRNVRLRDVLDEAARRLDAASAPGGRFHAMPGVQAALHETIGKAYLELGEHAPALSHLEVAYEGRERLKGAENADTLAVRAAQVTALTEAGRLDDAERIGQSALERARSALGSSSTAALAIANALGVTQRKLGRYDAAEALYREVLAGVESQPGIRATLGLHAANNLGVLLDNRGRYAEAEAHLRATVARAVELLGADDPLVFTLRGNLADAIAAQGRLPEAVSELGALLEHKQRVLGADHPSTLVTTNSVAFAMYTQGSAHDEQAEKLWLDVIPRMTRVLGEEHPNTLTTQSNLALLWWRANRLDESEQLNRRVLETRRRVLGPDHPDTLTSLNNLAGVYTKQGRQEECLAILVEVLGVQQRTLGELHPHALTTLGNCAICLQRLKRWNDAEAYSRQALAGWAAAPGDNALMLAQCRRQLAESLTALEQFETAEAELLEALAIVERHPGAGKARRVRVLRSLVALYEAWHSAAPQAGHDVRAAEHRSALASLQEAPRPPGAAPAPPAPNRAD